MRKLYISILITTLAAMLFSCTNDIDVNEIKNAECMQLTVMAPTTSESRAASVPSLTDGSLMQDLALFICTESNGIVNEVNAYRCVTDVTTPQTVLNFNLAEDDTNAATWITDKNNSSLAATHKYSKNLTSVFKGTYVVYVVANFTNNPDYTDVANIINAANSNLTSDNLRNQLNQLKNGTIKIGANNLCNAKKSMPLSLRDNLQIKLGNNRQDLHLLRTYTRIKVTVRNETAQFPIKVTNLQFNNITQQSIPIFVSQSYTPAKGSLTPDITNDSKKGTECFANISLNETKEIASLGTSGNEAVVFDGYVLESSVNSDDRDAHYQFDIGVQVVTGDRPDIYSIEQTENAAIDGDGLYLIKFLNENNYLCVDVTSNNSTVTKESLPKSLIVGDMESEKFLWIRDRLNIISNYLDKNGITNKYIDGKREGDVTFANSDRKLYADNNAIYWKNEDDGWLSDWKTFSITNNIKWQTKISDGKYYPDPEKTFSFTKVTEETPVKDPANTIPFTFTKMVGNRSEIVRSILRNEFYKIFINVRYNEKSKTFDFSVEDWNDKKLDIEFN